MTEEQPKVDPRYPFGVLTVPWYLAGLFLGIWTFGSMYVYHFSFVAEEHGWGAQSVGPQDFAGYVGFFFVAIVGFAATVALAIVHRRTFKLDLPEARLVVAPFVTSSLLFALPYVVVSIFYDQHRFTLPEDGNWPAISGICSVGFVHYVVLNAIAKRS